MDVAEAQREMREVYLNAVPGQAVSAAVWLVSAICATWLSARAAVLTLVFGGMLIFPLTQLILLGMGRRASVGKENPLRELAPQVAFIVPLLMPLAGVALLHRPSWFYPAFMEPGSPPAYWLASRRSAFLAAPASSSPITRTGMGLQSRDHRARASNRRS